MPVENEELSHTNGNLLVAEECCEEEIQPQVECATPQRHQINIEQIDHGFIVRVGCKTLAIEKVSTLVKHLEEFLTNPRETENLLRDGKLFNKE